MNDITEKTMLCIIKNFVAERGSQKQAAAAMGISESYLSDVLRGDRCISKDVANKFGYEKVIHFVKRIVLK